MILSYQEKDKKKKNSWRKRMKVQRKIEKRKMGNKEKSKKRLG